MEYNGPTTSHFIEGKTYQPIRSFEHPLLGQVVEVKNERGENSLITKSNKLFKPAR